MMTVLSSTSRPSEERLEPTRIELARQRRALSKTGLARALGVTPRSVTTYETDGAPHERLADLVRVLGFPESYFRDSREIRALDQGSVFFRARRRTSAYDRASATAVATSGTALYAWVLERFRLPAIDLAVDGSDFDDPRQAAKTLRNAWGLHDDAPVPNLVQLAEAHGVRVMGLPHGTDDVDAFSLWHEGAPYVFLSLSKTAERSRFDLAHELGHLLLHSYESPLTGERTDRIEREADAFAAVFLMPQNAVRRALRTDPSAQDVIEAKAHFKVSAMALNRSARDAGVMSDWAYRQNCVALTQLGYRTAEPSGMPRERSRVFRRVLDHLRSTGGSPRTILDDLAIPAEDLHALTFGLALVSTPPPTLHVI